MHTVEGKIAKTLGTIFRITNRYLYATALVPDLRT